MCGAMRCGAVRCCAGWRWRTCFESDQALSMLETTPPTLPGATRPGSQIPRPCARRFLNAAPFAATSLARVTAVDLPRPCQTQHSVHRSVGQRALAQRAVQQSTPSTVENAPGCSESRLRVLAGNQKEMAQWVHVYRAMPCSAHKWVEVARGTLEAGRRWIWLHLPP